jgi:hypothetical protein
MLTRDFTRSSNLSQVFTEVFIAENRRPYAISTDVHKLWKTAGPNSSFLSRILVRGGASTSPLLPSASSLGLPALELPGCDSAGLSLIRLYGAREKYSPALENVHTPCTVFPQHHFSIIWSVFHEFAGTNVVSFPRDGARSLQRAELAVKNSPLKKYGTLAWSATARSSKLREVGLSARSLFFRLFQLQIRPLKLKNSQRIPADN